MAHNKLCRQHRHDPRESLRVGDIVAITPGWRASKHVHHVVSSIIAPFGEPIEARPPVPTEEERVAEREARRLAKAERKRRRKSEEKSEGEASGVEGKEVKKDVEALNV
jgi:small subunit ribosomal protein S17